MPRERVKVYATKYADRKFYMLQWVDSKTGKKVSQTTDVTRKRDADRLAVEKEDRLNAVRQPEDGSMTWDDFWILFEGHLSGLSPDTQHAYAVSINQIQKLDDCPSLIDLTAQKLMVFVKKRREKKLAESTIAKDLRHFHGMLSWAVDQDYLPEIPKFPTIVSARNSDDEMKGRPLTDAEFELFLKTIPTAVPKPHQAPAVEHLSRGLWLSGLRMSEAKALRWEAGPWPWVDWANESRVTICFPGKQKSKKHETSPLAPDFVELLLKTPREDRTGYVFRIPGEVKTTERIGKLRTWGQVIVSVGKAARIVVEPETGKTASAHDLRRSFGARWAVKVMPMVLQKMMRHASIQTTQKYYVGANLDRTIDAIQKAWVGQSAKIDPPNSLPNNLEKT